MTANRWFPPPSPSRCPDCEGPVADRRCSACGLLLHGQAAATLWWLDRELHRLSAQRSAVLDQLRAATRAAAPAAAPRPPVAAGPVPAPAVGDDTRWLDLPDPPALAHFDRPETSSRDLQNLLLGLGAFLLAIASVVFATVTWTRLSAAVQGLVLAGLTAAAATGTAALRRKGLKATSEAVSAVAVFLALVDLHAVRISVAPGLEPRLYWSAALLALAAGAVAFGRLVKVEAAPVTACISAQLSLPLLLLGTHAGPGLLALGLLVQTAAAVTFLAVVGPSGRGTTWFLTAYGAATAWLIGTLLAVTRLVDGGPSASLVAPALVLLAAAVAVLFALWSQEGRDLGLGAATSLGLGALAGLLEHVATGDALVLAVGGAAVAVVAGAAWLGRDTRVDRSWLRAPGLVGSIGSGLALVPLAQPAAEALAGRFGHLDHVWTGHLTDSTRDSLLLHGNWSGSAVTSWYLGLFALALAALVAWLTWVPFNGHHGPSKPQPGTGLLSLALDAWAVAVWLVVAVPMVPLVVDAPVFVAIAWLLGWAAGSLAVIVLRPVAGRGQSPAWAVLFVTAALGLVWSFATPWGSVAALATLLVLSTVAALAAPPRAVTLPAGAVTTATLAIVLVPTIQRAAGASPFAAWLGLTVAAIAVSVAAWFVELRPGPSTSGRSGHLLTSVSTTLEMTAAAFTAVGFLGLIGSGTADQDSIGLALVTAAVAAHSTRRGRRFLVPVAVLGALALIWQRLVLGQVGTVEAYSLPAAIALLAMGSWYRRQAATSWEWSGPALVAAFGPTTLVALTDPGLTRPLGALVAAAALTLLGARSRLAAPLWVGTAVLLAIGLRHLGPVVDVLPRWVLFGVAGTVLLSVGATYERRRLGLARLGAKLRTFQ